MSYDSVNRITSFAGSSVLHDADGNMTFGPLPPNLVSTNSVARAITFGAYGYDSRNRLTSAAGLTYSYDAENNRIGITGTALSTSFLVDSSGGSLPRVIVRTKNGITTRYVYGPGNLGLQYEVNSSGSATYYHYDQVGNTTALTDSHGAVVERVAYSPYGLVRYRQSNFDTPFLYGGFWGVMSDPNSLVQMRARYYNPITMRFVSSDPAHDGWNWYRYANGDPVAGSDPSGLDAILTLSGMYLGHAVNASEFAGGSERGHMKSAYGNFQVNPDQSQTALPARIPKSDRNIIVANPQNGLQTDVRVTDVGPFNENDPYWKTGSRPAAEAQFANQTMAAYEIPSQNAGIDLTPKAMNNLGVTSSQNTRQAPVVWWKPGNNVDGFYPAAATASRPLNK